MRRTLIKFMAIAGLLGAGALGGLALAPRALGQAPAVTPKTQAPPEARALSRAFANVAKALRPSVVRIDVEVEAPKQASRGGKQRDPRQVPPDLRDFFERFFDMDPDQLPMPGPGPGRGTGSGLVLDTAGHILTNSHVVNKATKMTVVMADGRSLPARLVGMDEQTDTAVIKLESPPKGLVQARLGDSDRLEIGEWVIAVGSPLGLNQSVTAGIISSKGKVGGNVKSFGTAQHAGKVREYIQTDALINPGNSGGPLVNLDGEVIGINTVINIGPGGAYGFAIPINQARRVGETLIREGKVRYAFLGVQMTDVNEAPERGLEKPKGAPSSGALVTAIVPNSPAAKGGLRAGDVITKIDSEPAEGANDVIASISLKNIGSRVNVAFVREGKPSSVQVTLSEMPSQDELASTGPKAESGAVGIGLQDLTPELARFLNLPPEAKGAVITDVEPGSRAAKAGLRAEETILEVNRTPVTSAAEAASAIRAAKGSIVLRVRRGKEPPRFVTVPAP